MISRGVSSGSSSRLVSMSMVIPVALAVVRGRSMSMSIRILFVVMLMGQVVSSSRRGRRGVSCEASRRLVVVIVCDGRVACALIDSSLVAMGLGYKH